MTRGSSTVETECDGLSVGDKLHSDLDGTFWSAPSRVRPPPPKKNSRLKAKKRIATRGRPSNSRGKKKSAHQDAEDRVSGQDLKKMDTGADASNGVPKVDFPANTLMSGSALASLFGSLPQGASITLNVGTLIVQPPK